MSPRAEAVDLYFEPVGGDDVFPETIEGDVAMETDYPNKGSRERVTASEEAIQTLMELSNVTGCVFIRVNTDNLGNVLLNGEEVRELTIRIQNTILFVES